MRPTGSRGTRLFRTVKPYLVMVDAMAAGVVTVLVLHPPWAEVLVVTLGVLLTLAGRGAHHSRLTLSALDDVPDLALSALLGGVAHGCWLMVTGQPVDKSEVQLVVALAAALLLGRTFAFAAVREVRRRGYVEHRALVLGAGEVGRHVAQASLEHPEYGLRPVGFLDAGPVPDGDSLPVPMLGTFDRLAHFIRQEEVSEVIVAFLSDDARDYVTALRHDSELIDIVRQCDRMDCEIFSVPRFHELRHRGRDMDELWGIPLVRERRATWRSPSWVVKRIVDITCSAVALLVLAPLMVALALAVRIESGPGVLFRQVRVGLDGERFTLLKFRSLHVAPRAHHGHEVPVWSISGDARIGRVGRFMRTTSLDELPQLINVLRGEMSLVGPRPERPEFVAVFTELIPRYTARHRTPAGLTGLAQVNGLRGDTSIEERARFDNFYIQNWSLWLDAKILARTVMAVLRRQGS